MSVHTISAIPKTGRQYLGNILVKTLKEEKVRRWQKRNAGKMELSTQAAPVAAITGQALDVTGLYFYLRSQKAGREYTKKSSQRICENGRQHTRLTYKKYRV